MVKPFQLFKIGFGYDSHRFLTKDELASAPCDTGDNYRDPAKGLILGGERVEGFPPFLARSDGDVIMHAAVNAILSALGREDARDIGSLFPNTDNKNTNRASGDFLKRAAAIVDENSYAISDLKLMLKGVARVDLSKVGKNISALLGVDSSAVHLQGTSGEGMDGAGRGEGMEVYGVCALIHKELLDRL